MELVSRSCNFCWYPGPRDCLDFSGSFRGTVVDLDGIVARLGLELGKDNLDLLTGWDGDGPVTVLINRVVA